MTRIILVVGIGLMTPAGVQAVDDKNPSQRDTTTKTEEKTSETDATEKADPTTDSDTETKEITTNSVIAEQCEGIKDSAVCNDQTAKPADLAKNIINILLYVVGAISVVMVIVGGIMYATSTGDSGRVTLAKNTITYAIIGLVVSFLAFAIVQFVTDAFK